MTLPLEEYLASLNSSEAEFNKLSLVERSIIRTNFTVAYLPSCHKIWWRKGLQYVSHSNMRLEYSKKWNKPKLCLTLYCRLCKIMSINIVNVLLGNSLLNRFMRVWKGTFFKEYYYYYPTCDMLRIYFYIFSLSYPDSLLMNQKPWW